MGVNGAGRKNTPDAELNLHPLFVRSMGSLFQPSGLEVHVSVRPKGTSVQGELSAVGQTMWCSSNHTWFRLASLAGTLPAGGTF